MKKQSSQEKVISDSKIRICRKLFYPTFGKHEINFNCGPGWYNLIIEAINKFHQILLNRNLVGGIHIVQIKQKFGRLLIYIDIEDKFKFIISDDNTDLYESLRHAESKSASICEDCGKPGNLTPGISKRVMCKEHYEATYGKKGR
tara:strand:- start:7153 stop:7587 length:435 start_codon:yes stop_codon:yes gene_type:complete